MNEDQTEAAMLVRMAAALRQMPQRQRAIFVAVRNDQMTYAELGALFEITARQVEEELAEALGRLSDAADGRALSWRRMLLRWHRRYGRHE